jgi:hypothetical protein
VGADLASGSSTNVRAVSIGCRTPVIFAGANSSLCNWPLALYGCPYPAVPLVPSSSVAAVARKLSGATCTQLRTVSGGTSGEDSTTARPTVRTSATSAAIVPSLRMS